MTLRATALTRAAAVALALTSTRAPAAPSLWERARFPAARSEEQLLVALERMLDDEELAGPDVETAERIARAAVAMLDLKQIRKPESARLAFMEARALLDADVGRTAEAQALLETAVARLPTGPLLADAWHELGVARALGGDHAAARDAQSRVLELAWDPDERAVAYYYRAASELRLRDLGAAERDYRLAAERTREPETQALARFGLGLVLERGGDLPSAYAAFERGLAIRQPLSAYAADDPLDLPGMFFTPSYERFYVAALLVMTRLRHEESAAARRVLYEQGVADWDAYLLAAAADDPWVSNARHYRERCAAELHRLPRAHGKGAPR